MYNIISFSAFYTTGCAIFTFMCLTRVYRLLDFANEKQKCDTLCTERIISMGPAGNWITLYHVEI